MYSPEFIKPTTVIFTQQPDHYFHDIGSIDSSSGFGVGKYDKSHYKPVAFVSPIEKYPLVEKSVQTEPIMLMDSTAYIHSENIERSLRIFGKLETIKGDMVRGNDDDVSELIKKNQQLENSLKVQFRVNEDLKKLLVASLGDDLSAHFTKMTSVIATLNEKVSDLLAEKFVANEDIDRMSIEADLWKNKFVAGRLVMDELADWKQQFSARYYESVEAIQVLLHERQSLRLQMSMLSDQLLSISSHLSIKNPIKKIVNCSSLDIARENLEFAISIQRNLEMGAKWVARSKDDSSTVSTAYSRFTNGEESAVQILIDKPDSVVDITRKALASINAEHSRCIEKMAVHSCRNCKGDIFVV